jgi:hypothetical protein
VEKAFKVRKNTDKNVLTHNRGEKKFRKAKRGY